MTSIEKLNSAQTERVEKLQSVATGRQAIARNKLVDRVLQSQAVLVLFAAPAGFGKTTAMLQLQEALINKGERTAWLTLDKADHELERFLKFFHESLQGPVTNSDLAPFGLTIPSRESVTIFFDDFESVSGTSIPSIVRDLLSKLPRGSKLIIGTRQQPGLGLARLRAQGLVLDLGVADLQFSKEESRKLLTNLGDTELIEEEITLIQQRTEGWPAAIALASMALIQVDGSSNNDFIQRISLTIQPIAEYLADVVLSRQSDDLSKFLLSTSILRTLNIEVCNALVPKMDAAYVLEQLQRSNLFVTQIPGHSDQWRYHPLFSDFLRARLLKQSPDEYQRLHLIASGWYESKNLVKPAIEHAIAGGDPPYAADLLKDHGTHLLADGRLKLLDRWFAMIPVEALIPHPHLIACALWAITFTQGAISGRRYFEKLKGSKILKAPGLSEHLQALECTWLLMQDKPDEAYAIGVRALALLPTREAYADNVLSISMAILMAQRGEREKAHALLDQARSRLGDKSFMRMYIESAEGEQDMQDGLLRQATARFRIALGASHSASHVMHDLVGGNAWSGVLYAVTCYESDRLDEAQRLLTAYLPVVRSMGLHEHQILTFLLLSRIARTLGKEDHAIAYLAELEHAGLERNLPRLTATAWLERARVETILGHAEAAATALSRADLPNVWNSDHKLRRLAHSNLDLRISNLRWALQFGDPRRALSEIDAELTWSRSAKWPLRMMTYQILRAIGLNRIGQSAIAIEQMREAIIFAAEQGFVRRVIDEGPLALALANEVLEKEETNDENPLLVEYLRRLLNGFDILNKKQLTTQKFENSPSETTEKLTSKEMEAIKLIADGHSNNAMAEKLGVSTSTVRTHLRNINSKLGVSSRMQAVAKARKLGLLR